MKESKEIILLKALVNLQGITVALLASSNLKCTEAIKENALKILEQTANTMSDLNCGS